MSVLKSSRRNLCALYRFSDEGGAIGTISLWEFTPQNFTITSFCVRVISACASGGSATVAFGINGVSTTCLMGATAVGSLTTTNAVTRGVDLDAAPIFVANASAITMTIATAALTAGQLLVLVEGYQTDL